MNGMKETLGVTPSDIEVGADVYQVLVERGVRRLSETERTAIRLRFWRCLTIDDVDWLIPHQTGRNIIDAVTEQLKIPPERVVVVIDHIGNVSGATLPIALDEARRQGRLRNGDTIVLTAVGAG